MASGRFQSGRSSDDEAKAERKRNGRLSEKEATGQAETKPPGTNHISKITTIFPTAAREAIRKEAVDKWGHF
jgi:hypothetical protein